MSGGTLGRAGVMAERKQGCDGTHSAPCTEEERNGTPFGAQAWTSCLVAAVRSVSAVQGSRSSTFQSPPLRCLPKALRDR